MQEIYRIFARFAARRRQARVARAKAQADRWTRDPLSHPALRAMSARELADLPLDPGLFRQEARQPTIQAAAPRRAHDTGAAVCNPA